MKDDVQVPHEVPKKRRQLEAALDLWLAVWLARDDLTPSERRRVEEEKRRRKALNPPLVIGFTGSRAGLTPQQKALVSGFLDGAQESMANGSPVEAHHGDCIGADEQFHKLCLARDIPVVLHPCDLPGQRAWCQGAVRVEPTKRPLDRNKDIVRASTFLVATPKEMSEPAPGRGQGTWSTVRYARQRPTKLIVVYPDGIPREGV